MLVQYLFKLGKDYRRLMYFSSAHFATREGIAAELDRMQTHFGRLRLIRLVDLKVQRPTGEWPDGEIPNFDNSPADTLLAQLEEKWLGLDR